jgi:hypothetical protein
MAYYAPGRILEGIVESAGPFGLLRQEVDFPQDDRPIPVWFEVTDYNPLDSTYQIRSVATREIFPHRVYLADIGLLESSQKATDSIIVLLADLGFNPSPFIDFRNPDWAGDRGADGGGNRCGRMRVLTEGKESSGSPRVLAGEAGNLILSGLRSEKCRGPQGGIGLGQMKGPRGTEGARSGRSPFGSWGEGVARTRRSGFASGPSWTQQSEQRWAGAAEMEDTPWGQICHIDALASTAP